MKVKNILETKKRRGQILQVSAAQPLAAAIKIMVTNDTGSVAIFDGDAFVGMLTFREILASLDERGFPSSAEIVCGDVVDRNGICTTPDDSVDQLRSMMLSQHIRYLPVVVDGKLTDVISLYDVARAVAKEVDFENRMLKEYIGDWPSDSK